MQVFSKALEHQNLEFFTNYDHLNNKRQIVDEYKLDVKNVDYVGGVQVKIRVLDIKRNYELREKKRRNMLELMLVEIFVTMILGETDYSKKEEVAEMFESVVTYFSDMGIMMRFMSSLTRDSDEYICQGGWFRVPLSSVKKKCVLEIGQESGIKLFLEISESSRLMSSMNHFQLAIIQIHVFLKLAMDCKIIPDNFSEVFSKMTRMIQDLCRVISISEAADQCYQTVKFLKMNDMVLKIPNPFK